MTRPLAVFASALALLASALWPPTSAPAQTPPGELVDRTALRVCADPAELPLSNDRGEGFENRIAELVARRLGVPFTYTWYPNTVGFVRNTLRALKCDVIMGVIQADELTQNTNPYYHSTFVLVHRKADGDRFASLDTPEAALARIGVIAGTPPASLLARRGLMGPNVRPYHLMVDTRQDNPARQMVQDLEAGLLDMALVWGPLGGWWAKQAKEPLSVVPLPSDPRAGLRMDYRISMGIRPNEPTWKHDLNNLIQELQPEIDRILMDYGVPLLDNRGRLIHEGSAAQGDAIRHAAAELPRESASAIPPEPNDYRQDHYRAPVPATLEGAVVLDAPALRTLLATALPILIDVFPQAPPPEGRPADALWLPPERRNIPGSVWLPNVGYGTLPPDTASWFAQELAGLTAGDRARPLVFYCEPQCWMSWNAARRAVRELGYTAVHWYPGGAEAWRAAGMALAPATPAGSG